MLTVLFFIIATCILSAVNGFSPSQTRHSSFIIKTHNYLVHLHHHTSLISHNTRLCSSPEDKQAEIEALESEQAELSDKLADGSWFVKDAAAATKASERLGEIDEILLEKMERWDELENMTKA